MRVDERLGDRVRISTGDDLPLGSRFATSLLVTTKGMPTAKNKR